VAGGSVAGGGTAARSSTRLFANWSQMLNALGGKAAAGGSLTSCSPAGSSVAARSEAPRPGAGSVAGGVRRAAARRVPGASSATGSLSGVAALPRLRRRFGSPAFALRPDFLPRLLSLSSSSGSSGSSGQPTNSPDVAPLMVCAPGSLRSSESESSESCRRPGPSPGSDGAGRSGRSPRDRPAAAPVG
jgi:hypothetical protein